MTPPLRYVLDTNICIIKDKPAAVWNRIDSLRPGEVGQSAVTKAERLPGGSRCARRNHHLAAVLSFAPHLVMFPFDSQVTEAYGRARAGLQHAGPSSGPLDIQIAATTSAHGLILVTNDTREFAGMPDLKIGAWTQCGIETRSGAVSSVHE